MISAILIAALVQTAAINSQRDKFISCLEGAEASAKAQKMAPEAVEAHLRQTCAAQEASFTASLIAFDLKNKVARKQAAADAKLQIDDFVSGKVAHYKRTLTLSQRG
jgi:hypothetical protein